MSTFMRMRCLKGKEVCDASILYKKKRNEVDLYKFKRSTTNNLKLKGKGLFFLCLDGRNVLC